MIDRRMSAQAFGERQLRQLHNVAAVTFIGGCFCGALIACAFINL